jgi:hypothetical protein
MPARPAVNNKIATWLALMSSRSRMEGRTPPNPPMIEPVHCEEERYSDNGLGLGEADGEILRWRVAEGGGNWHDP